MTCSNRLSSTRAHARAGARHGSIPARVAAAVVGLAGALASACSGSSSAPPTAPVDRPAAPAIQELSSDRATYSVGEVARLTVRFTGGTGRLEPRVGAVRSGDTIVTPVLDASTEFRLVVESSAGTVTRTLALPVNYRNRLRTLDGGFAAAGHTASLVTDGSVVLTGGWRGGNAPTDAVDRFDPALGTFQRIGTLVVARQGHAAVRLDDGRLFITGGDAWLSGQPSAELLDPRTGRSTATGRPRVSRTDAAVALLPSGRVLVTGGYARGESAQLGISRSAEIWDPATGEFRLLAATMGVPREGHTATLLGDGRVLLAGGASPAFEYDLLEVFDPVTETFASLPAPDRRVRYRHGAVSLPDGSALVIGGDVGPAEPAPDVTVLKVGADGRVERLADLLLPRTRVAAAVTRDGRVFLFGGESRPGFATTTAEVYSAEVGPLPIVDLPAPRYGHTVTRLLDGRLLIAGGENESVWLLPPLLYE